MGRTKIKGKSAKRLRTEQVRVPRIMSWVSMFWGILYCVIAMSITFSYFSDILKQLVLCLGVGLSVLPYFLFPVYLSSYYPKERAPFMLPAVFGLLGLRFVIYALFYESQAAGSDIISWKTALWAVALFALVVFVLVISTVLKGILHSGMVYFGVLLSLLPAFAVSGLFAYSACERSPEGIVLSVSLILFLLCGEVLLHLAMLLFCKKGSIAASELE